MNLEDPFEVRQLLLETKILSTRENLSLDVIISILELQAALLKYQLANGWIYESPQVTN